MSLECALVHFGVTRSRDGIGLNILRKIIGDLVTTGYLKREISKFSLTNLDSSKQGSATWQVKRVILNSKIKPLNSVVLSFLIYFRHLFLVKKILMGL